MIRLLLSLLLGCLLLVLDQCSKLWVAHTFTLGESLPVMPCFSLTYVQNQGAAWGMFQGAQLALAIFAIVAMIACVIFWKRLFGTHRAMIPLGAMLFSGILGNLIDRVRLGYVIDFADFYWGPHHFPCFNIADSAICLAVFGILLVNFLTREAKQ